MTVSGPCSSSLREVLSSKIVLRLREERGEREGELEEEEGAREPEPGSGGAWARKGEVGWGREKG